MRKTILLALLFGLIAGPGWCATYYINSAAAGGGDGSIGTPFDQFSDWEAVAANSDVLYIQGTLDETLDIDVNDVTVDEYGAGGVVAVTAKANCIDITGTGTTIQNISVSGSTDAHIKVAAGANDTTIQYVSLGDGVDGVAIITTSNTTTHDIDINNCSFTFVSAAGTHEGVSLRHYDGDDDASEQIYNISITYNTFTNVGNAVEIWAAEQVDVDPGLDGDNTASRSPYNFVFDNNTVTGCADAWIVITAGLKDAGDGNFIRNNTFNGAGSASQADVNGLQLQWCRNLTVSGNTATDVETSACDGAVFIVDFAYTDEDNLCDGVVIDANKISYGDSDTCNGAGVTLWRGKDTTISNNVIENNDFGIQVSLNHASNTGNKIVNNLIRDNTNDGIAFIAATGQSVTVKNNIITGNDGEGVDDNSSNDPPTSNNAYYDNTGGNYSGFVSGGNDVTSDPLLNSDGSLTSSSPAINAGATAGTVSLTGSQTDAFGNTETFDTFFKMNIGADLTKFNTPSILSGALLAGTFLPEVEEATETPTWIGGESITFIGGETFEWQ